MNAKTMMRLCLNAVNWRMLTLAVAVFAFTAALESRDADIKPAVDTFPAQCTGQFGPRECTINVWRRADLAAVPANERAASTKHVFKREKGRKI